METNKGSQDGNEDRSGDGAGMVTGTGVKTLGQTQDGNGDESGGGNESSSGDGNGDEGGNGNGNEDGVGEGGREAKTRNKPHKSCRRHVGNKGDFGGKGKIRRQDTFSSVAVNPDNL